MEDKKQISKSGLGTYVPPAMFRNGWVQAVEIAPKEAEPAQTAVAASPMGCNPYLMASVQKQVWETPYEPETGFERGTIFPMLDAPFMGEGACRRGR